MSQAGILSEDTSPLANIETLTGNVGGAVGPDAAHNVNILGGVGIDVVGNPATNTLTISDDDLVQGNVTTLNAIPATCINFPLGVVPGVYILDGRLAAHDTTDVAGAGYFFTAAFRTTGAIALLIAVRYQDDFEELAMEPSDFNLIALGNSAILQVFGINAKTINWSGEFEYQFVG